MGEVQQELLHNLKDSDWRFPAETDLSRGKISRGENYKGLPWMMLDFPRLFSNEKTVALRTFFLWGNSYSCHLLVAGSALPDAIRALIECDRKINSSSKLSIQSDRWQHHFDESTYLSVNELSDEQIVQLFENQNYLKLSKWFSLANPELLPHLACDFFTEAGLLIGLLKK